MITLFQHAPGSQDSGSTAYYWAVLSGFSQNLLSGYVDIQPSNGGQIVLLFLEGALLEVYHLSDDTCTEISLADLNRYWPGGDAKIRSVKLPNEALRVAKAALEWYPPKQIITVQSDEVQSFLDSYKDQHNKGLLHASWADAEGFALVHGGQILSVDAVYCMTVGIGTGLDNFRMFLTKQEGPCELRFYEARPTTSAYQQQSLRIALAKLSRGIFTRYNQLVGRSLTSALVGDIHAVMHSKFYSIRVNGDTAEDTHVFHTTEAMAQTYQLVVKVIVAHISKVIGSVFATRILVEAFNTLDDDSKKIIQERSLLPMGVSR